MRSSNDFNSSRRPKATGIALFAVLSLCIGATHAKRPFLPNPITDADFTSHSETKIYLGMLLFYDKILSGNRNISCATCHHSLTDTGDGLSLPVGEGGRGLGVARDTGEGKDAIEERVPRNAPFVFNLGANEYKEMFHDGRVEEDVTQPSGFRSPAGDFLPLGLESVLAVQACFPVTSGAEMAGQAGENDIANILGDGNPKNLPALWEALAERLRGIEEYVDLFEAAYDDVQQASDITYVHAANAIAAYEDAAFRAINSPFDEFLRGDPYALSKKEKGGMWLFYGKAGCSACHSGPLQTDHGYHAVAMPQIGPGKGDFQNGDFGREQATEDGADRYKFRTPSLRNTALTGPWGHAGAYNSLEAMVRHQLDPVSSLYSYDIDPTTNQAVLPAQEDLDKQDFVHMSNPDNVEAIANASEIKEPVNLSDAEVARLIAFLHALTDPASLDLRTTMPTSVPSGLPLAD